MKWQYFLFTLGSLPLLIWDIRSFLFTFYESPKYLMEKVEADEAMAVLRNVARVNAKEGSVKMTSHVWRMGMDRDWAKPCQAAFATRKLVWSTALLIVLWSQSFVYYKQSFTKMDNIVPTVVIEFFITNTTRHRAPGL